MYTSSFNRIALASTFLTIVSFAGGCSSIDRLSQIGEQPKLSEIENPTTKPGYKPVQMPMPKPEAVSYNANSLWRNGSRSFFKDQRAHQIGDLLTVTVNITDQANFANETARSRTSSEDSGITAFLGSGSIPFRQAIAAEAGQIHQVDVLHVGTLAQVLHEPPEGSGLEFGTGLLVHLASPLVAGAGIAPIPNDI